MKIGSYDSYLLSPQEIGTGLRLASRYSYLMSAQELGCDWDLRASLASLINTWSQYYYVDLHVPVILRLYVTCSPMWGTNAVSSDTQAWKWRRPVGMQMASLSQSFGESLSICMISNWEGNQKHIRKWNVGANQNSRTWNWRVRNSNTLYRRWS